jgi:hypothetical protein
VQGIPRRSKENSLFFLGFLGRIASFQRVTGEKIKKIRSASTRVQGCWRTIETALGFLLFRSLAESRSDWKTEEHISHVFDFGNQLPAISCVAPEV